MEYSDLDTKSEAHLPDPPPVGRWGRDLLGDGFEARTLPLHDDEEGEVAATLVRHVPVNDPHALPGTPSAPSAAMLAFHGWNDYFHSVETARQMSRLGYAFYAIDLRKYGRSLRSHQLRGYTGRLSEYDEDIHAARDIIFSEHGLGVDLTFFAHSAGGLITSLWAHRHPGALRALVLNSPWLAPIISEIITKAAAPMVNRFIRQSPRARVPVSLPSHNLRALSGVDPERIPEGSEDDPHYTGWNLDPGLRLANGAPIHAGWYGAIREGLQRVGDGLSISCPILVLTSDKSVTQWRWTEEMRQADSVLDVSAMREAALNLGPLVTMAKFTDAVHDVVLSRRDVRAKVFAEVERWLRTYSLR